MKVGGAGGDPCLCDVSMTKEGSSTALGSETDQEKSYSRPFIRFLLFGVAFVADRVFFGIGFDTAFNGEMLL